MTDTTASGQRGGVSSLVGGIRTRLEGPNTVGTSRGFWIGFALTVLALVAFPVLSGTSGNQFSLFLVLALLGLSLSLVWGYAGILSFGQVVFFGIGAYAFGVVSINVATASGITGAVFVGTTAGAVVAALLGYFMFYGGVRDVYVTIITLVSTLVMLTFMAQTAGSEWTIGEAALGGFNGMPDIPLLTLGIEGVFSFQFVFNDHEVFVPLLGTGTVDPFYYLALGLLLVAYLGLRVLVNTDFGRVLVAIREDEDRTMLFGYDVKRAKLIAFTLGGGLAGLSGVLYAARNVYIDPSVFQLYFATLPVVWVSVGGRKRLLGAVLATIGIEYVRLELGGELALVAVGALLLLSIMLLPGGIVPWIEDRLTSNRIDVADLDSPDGAPEVSDS
jgi:branched-chain amino acid transport system permease protein